MCKPDTPGHILFILGLGLAQQVGQRARHRFMPSTRNRIERFWAEVNLCVNLPVKLMLVSMEQLNILDVGNVHHIGAVQSLLKPVIDATRARHAQGHVQLTLCALIAGAWRKA